MIKIIGLQKSGTNWLQNILKEGKLPVYDTDTPIWKHEEYHLSSDELENISFLIMITKSPYTWLNSINVDRRDLVERKKLSKEFTYFEALSYWTKWHKEWIDNVNMHIKYEDMLLNPLTSINNIPFEIEFENETEMRNVPGSSVILSDSKLEYYLTPPYNLTENIIKKYNTGLDPVVMNALGYEIL